MADALWRFDELQNATGGRADGQTGAITSVSIDTRTLEAGALFVAIRGVHQDGHSFVAKAFEVGAAAALVANDFNAVGVDGALIRVPDPLKALERLGEHARVRTHAHVIAVTGSVGKTGTKEALRHCLSTCGQTHAAERSFNNHWGVPLTLARMPATTAFGVFEIGMNHSGEITPLTKMVRPHTAIITNVEPVHLGHFESVEQIAEAKAEIFKGLVSSGVAVLNRDNPHFECLRQHAADHGVGRIVAFGVHPDANVRLLGCKLGPLGSDITVDLEGTPVACRIGVPGRHLVQNILAVIAALGVANVDVERATKALTELTAPKGRGARKIYRAPDGAVLVIDESYNANPTSMRAAIAALGHVSRDDHNRRVVVLGDMLELGEQSAQLHRDLLQPLLDIKTDLVLACGKHMQDLYDALPSEKKGGYAEDSDGLCQVLLETVRGGDAVMLKGSLGSRIGPLVAALSGRLQEADDRTKETSSELYG